MKYALLLATLTGLLSCRKDDLSFIQFVFDETDSMMITPHDVVVDATTNTYEVSYDLNLDNEGLKDIRIFSREYKTNSVEDTAYEAWIKILNPHFSIAEIPASNILYETTGIVYDYYGTFPRKTFVETRYCEYLEGAVADTGRGTVRTFEAGEKFIDVHHWDHYYGEINLTREPQLYQSWNFSAGGDSLIGNRISTPGLCQAPETDQPFFIAFKKRIGTESRYGWIRLEITDRNAVRIIESAIQQE